MNSKVILRKQILQYRQLLSQREFEKRNQLLNDLLLAYIRKENPKAIHTFLPIKRNNEFDIQPLLPELWKNGVKTMVSKTDFNRKSLEHFWLTDQTTVSASNLGIPEPVNAEKADISEANLIVVPLLASDKSGHRIGYGGGYYDNILEKFEGRSVGVCLSSLFDQIRNDAWDVPVTDMVYYKRN